MRMDLTKWQDNFEIENENVSLFGLNWNAKLDTLSLPKTKEIQVPFTKRQLTGFICGFWDPLGILAPVLIGLKCCLSDLWRAKIGWDEPVPANQSREIFSIVESFAQISNVSIPRFFRGCFSKGLW